MTRNTLLGLCILSLSCGCEEEKISTAPPTPAASGAKGGRRARGAQASPTASSSADLPPKVDFQEEDFMETERSRDPFRSFADLFVQQSRREVREQRTVISADYTLEELRLIGVISRISPAKAMLVDPMKQGHVIHRGDFVGRAERVQGATPDADYELNWRVDRIRDSDVVFVREDPSNPDVPTATRVISLHSDARPGL